MGFVKRNIDKTRRNGRVEFGTNTIKYVANGSFSDGKDGTDSYTVILTPNSRIFEAGPNFAIEGQTDRLNVVAFKGLQQIPTYIDSSIAGTIPGSLDIVISNNGTSSAYIDVFVHDSLRQASGVLEIPVKVNTQIDSSTGGPEIWDASSGINFAIKTCYYNWALAFEGKSDYRLDLTNENASVNVDSSGNINPSAYKYLHCDANLLHGGEEVPEAEYAISYPSEQSVTGVTIDSSTGEFTFASNFNFTGDALEITATARIGTVIYGTSIMTISKNYPGIDGQPAVSYWLELSTDSVKVNPNASSPSAVPSTVTATARKQVGGQDPVTATEAVIKYSFNSTTATTTYTGPISIDISKTYLRIEMFVNGKWQDGETIPIMYDGVNGTSAYVLDLSNQAATINADAGENILPGAVRPTCKATLYYGSLIAEGVTYSLSYPTGRGVQGVSINASTGQFTFNAGTAATPFSFNGRDIELTVTAKIGSTVCGTSIMTISKACAGTNGLDGANGKDGKDGLDIVWKGESSAPPANPQKNWCYRDTDDGRVYIYNGSSWELMTHDGSDGTDGTNGSDGLSVFITYHDNAASSTPATPTGTGTSGGWHTNPTNASVWMSQKVAASASAGTWGAPVRIKGTDGANGRDGSDGADGVSYWMTLSADAIHVDKNGNVAPSTIAVTKHKQVGSSAPTDATDCTVKYGYDTQSPSTTYSSTITVNKNHSYIAFGMYLGSTLVDGIEIVPILVDGADGQPGSKGDQGLKGPTLRGPVDWTTQTTTRRFCNGVLTSSAHPEDAEWIDLMLRENQFYKCKTSYTGSCNDSWSSVSQYWEVASAAYNFISTGVLLATNAKIRYLSSNQMTFMNDAGTQVVAGGQGGSGVNFWAGSSTPGSAPFRVNYDGSIVATKGYFSGAVQMPYYFISDLPHTGSSSNGYYIADTQHTYLIADSHSGYYGMGDGGYLRLPEPSASNNGVTYHIICEPNIATKSTSQNPSLTVMTINSTNSFLVFCTDDYSMYWTEYKRFSFLGGHFELTCVPRQDGYGNITYHWALTRITGNVRLYSGNTPSGAVGSVYTYSTQHEYFLVNRIVGDASIPSSKQTDTLYIPRS